MTYKAPTAQIDFILTHVVPFADLARTDRFDGLVGVAVLLAGAALVAYVRREERYSPAGIRNAG